MKKSTTPPFAWLGKYWFPVAFTLLMITAAYFRFYQLGELPPGLDEASARTGLDALAINPGHLLPALDAGNGYAPLWVWLQALAVAALGHTVLALRVWPAVLGTLAVAATWLWLRSWFNRPIAWIGAFVLAVSPWAVTISRSGLQTALLTLLVPLTLWLALRLSRQTSAGRAAAFAAVIIIDLLSGPLGWLLAAAVGIISLLQLIRRRPRIGFTQPRLIAAGILVLGGGLAAYLAAQSWTAIAAMPQALGVARTGSDFVHNLLRVALMFNVHGDENYRHNLAGEPMLNAFIGLMMVAGLLVALSRFFAVRYRALLALTLVMLAPAVLASGGVPNSSWAAGALPLLIGLSAIGTYYMLELWYATFPINSAARATGQAAIVLLLALTMVQGYTQYFGAWADSTAVHLAYNEGTVGIAKQLRASKFTGERYTVTSADQIAVITYLDHDLKNYRSLQAADVAALPIATASRKFYIGAVQRDETAKTLKAKFPGGILRPHYSDFNQLEIYYTYETVK
ncbi:MAG: hypothetical protein NVS3B29_00810 [Candidatus Saccharimonadales bacterium]